MPNTDVRRVSRQVYGNRYLLEVAGAIGELGTDETTQKQLADITGIERNVVALVIKRLEAAGLVQRVGGRGREQPLRRAQSVFWRMVAAHLKEVHGEYGGSAPLPADQDHTVS